MDLPGFGLTGPHPSGDYTLPTYLNFLHAFLKKLGVKHCALAGNSLGGEIAWRYTVDFPEEVNKLILIDAAGYSVEAKEVPVVYIILRIPWLRELVIKETPPAVIRASLEYLYADREKVTEKLVSLYYDMTCREGNREALTERMESIAQNAPLERLSNIQIPVLVLWGEKDMLIPLKYGRHFNQRIPESELVTFAEAGHMPMEEIPEKTVLVAKRFLEKQHKKSSKDSIQLK